MEEMVILQQTYYLQQDKQLQGHQLQEGQLQVHKHKIQQQVQHHQLLAQERQ